MIYTRYLFLLFLRNVKLFVKIKRFTRGKHFEYSIYQTKDLIVDYFAFQSYKTLNNGKFKHTSI